MRLTSSALRQPPARFSLGALAGGLALVTLSLAGCKAGGNDRTRAPYTDDGIAREEPDLYGAESDYEPNSPVTTASAGQAMPEPAELAASEDSRRGGVFKRRSRAAQAEIASPSGSSNEPPSVPAPAAATGQPSDGAEAAVAKPRKDLENRYIVYVAFMQVSVFDLEMATRKIESLPETYGGYVQSMSPGQIVLRLPSVSLRSVMDEIGEHGVVENRTLQSQDVTAEFVDLESRIRALEETQSQLLELLSKARTVQEALQVRSALDDINTELEVLKGRLRQLDNQVTYSTITISLIERGPHQPTPSSNDPFPWVDDLGVESTEWK